MTKRTEDKDTIRVEVDDEVAGFAVRQPDNTWRAVVPDRTTPIGQEPYRSSKSAANAVFDSLPSPGPKP